MDGSINGLLTQIAGLNGVNQASVYVPEQEFYSTLAEAQHDGMIEAAKLFEQIFSTLRSIGKDHNELYVEFSKGMMIAYDLSGIAIVLLVTEKKVNLPMIGLGVKTASRSLESFFRQSGSDASGPGEKGYSAKKPAPEFEPLSDTVQSVSDQLKDLLIDFLGPAAVLVHRDSLEEWQARYKPTSKALGYLVELLCVELETAEEKSDFKQQARKIRP